MSYIAVMNVSGPNSAMRLKQVKQTRSSKGRLPAKLPVTAKPEINNLSVCLFAKRRFKRNAASSGVFYCLFAKAGKILSSTKLTWAFRVIR
ncbi:hypothetical protein IB024_00030 [Brucella sp. 6810]|uniref:hypothetical protein n=1 Tax=Brucella sp. 6810 TaxID=2769351 RepID=UPI00165AC319|nr:hypothetical protein [Brucella sp. 6810]QNQ63350.1 hypothetical protein IB024_00030 [Brucella sp. 6810]